MNAQNMSYGWGNNIEFCGVCEKKIARYTCNVCEDIICKSKQCCEIFPHYNNTQYIVCYCCYNEIDSKLKLRKYPPELDTLKSKIEKYHREKRRASLEKKVDENVEQIMQQTYRPRSSSSNRSVLGR